MLFKEAGPKYWSLVYVAIEWSTLSALEKCNYIYLEFQGNTVK